MSVSNESFDAVQYITQENLIFTPYQDIFLQFVQRTQKELILAVPFFKRSIAQNIIASLPIDHSISIRILTRFNENVFRQGASDIESLLLMLAYAGRTNDVQAYALNRIHAKIYIRDEEELFLTSSNLSPSGFVRNYEVAYVTHNPALVSDAVLATKSYFTHDRSITNNDLDVMEASLRKHNQPYFSPSHSDEQDEVDVPCDIEVRADGYYISSDLEEIIAAKRLDDMAGLLFSRSRPSFSKAGDYVFKSPNRPKSLGNEKDASFLNELFNSHAQQDLEALTLHVNTILSDLCCCCVDGHRLFVEKSWLQIYQDDKDYRPVQYFYGNFGARAFHLWCAQILTNSLLFSGRPPDDLAVKAIYILHNTDYGRLLDVLNLRVALHAGDLPKNFEYDLFMRIFGFIAWQTGIDQAFRTFRAFHDPTEGFELISYREFDVKTFLQTQMQGLYHFAPKYHLANESGPSHDKTFEVAVEYKPKASAFGRGSTMKEAQRDAAYNAILHLASRGELAAGKRLSVKLLKYELTIEREKVITDWLSNLSLDASNPRLYDVALTHSSFVFENRWSRSNRLLAYIGTHVVKLVEQQLYYQKHPDITPDFVAMYKLHQRRPPHYLVDLFEDWNCSAVLRCTSKSEISTSAKWDVAKAVLTALYLCEGLSSVKETLEKYIQYDQAAETDPVSSFQVLMQARGKSATSIEYRILGKSGPDHNSQFHAGLFLEGVLQGSGWGASYRAAKSVAAKQALESTKQNME